MQEKKSSFLCLKKKNSDSTQEKIKHVKFHNKSNALSAVISLQSGKRALIWQSQPEVSAHFDSPRLRARVRHRNTSACARVARDKERGTRSESPLPAAANRLTGARWPLGWGDGSRVEPQIHQEPAETGDRGGDTADGVQRGQTLRSDGEYNRTSLWG